MTDLVEDARRLAYLGRVWREQEGMNVTDLDELARLAEKVGNAIVEEVTGTPSMAPVEDEDTR